MRQRARGTKCHRPPKIPLPETPLSRPGTPLKALWGLTWAGLLPGGPAKHNGSQVSTSLAAKTSLGPFSGLEEQGPSTDESEITARAGLSAWVSFSRPRVRPLQPQLPAEGQQVRQRLRNHRMPEVALLYLIATTDLGGAMGHRLSDSIFCARIHGKRKGDHSLTTTLIILRA